MTATLKPLLPYTSITNPISAVATTDDFFLLYDDLGSTATIMSLSVSPSTYAVTQISTGTANNVDHYPGDGVLSVDTSNRRVLMYARNSTASTHYYGYYTYDASGNLTEQADTASGVTSGSDDRFFETTYSSTYDRFFTYWIDTGNGDDLIYTYGTPGASSITWQTTPTTAKAGTGNLSYPTATQVGGGTVAVAYYDGTNGVEVIAGTQSTTTITWGTAISVTSEISTAAIPSITSDGSNIYIASYDGTQFFVKKYSVSGNTISLTDTINFSSNYPAGVANAGMGIQYDSTNDQLIGSFYYDSSAIRVVASYVIPGNLSEVRITSIPHEGVSVSRFGAIGPYDDGTGLLVLGKNVEGDSNDVFVLPYEVETIAGGGTTGLTGTEDLFLLKGKTRAYDLA